MHRNHSSKQFELNCTSRFDAVLAEYLEAIESGAAPSRQEFLARYPDLAAELREFFANGDRMETLLRPVAGTDTVRITIDEKTGRRFGNYELLEEIARGGMGIVYRARQVGLNRTVALKMIRESRLSSHEDKRRFRAEAEMAANLQHPNIVAIFDVGEYEGQPYFSMDYVEGSSLSDLIAEKPLPPRRAATYVHAAAEAIHYAHAHNVLHRDLKPSNILVDTTDRIRITDFGLARRLNHDSSLTGTGQLLGTPSYMSPEQAAAKHEVIGPASDIYSLGVVLFELLTGRPPFRAANPLDTLLQIKHTEPVPPRLLNPKVPRDLETICLKCLQKEPTNRYATSASLAEDLERFLTNQPIYARPIPRPARLWRWCRRNPVVASLAAVVLTLLIAIAVGSSIAAFWLRNQRDTVIGQKDEISQAKQAEEQAKNEALKQLFESYLAQARAGRFSQKQGQRFDSLKAIAEAAKLVGPLRMSEEQVRALRNEAIACLALPDLRLDSTLADVNVGDPSWCGFDPQFTKFAYADSSRNIHLRSVVNGEELCRVPAPKNDFRELQIRFSADGKLLAVGVKSDHDQVSVYDVTGSEAVVRLSLEFSDDFAFMPDARTFAVGDSDGSLAFYDLVTGGKIRNISERYVVQLAFSPSGDRFATRHANNRDILIIDSTSGKELQRFHHIARISDARPSAWRFDGRLLAVACNDQRIHIWDTELNRKQAVLEGHQGVEIGIRFCPSSGVLISECRDLTTRFWDPVSGRQMLSMLGKFAEVSADGRRIAMLGETGSVSFWEFTEGRELRTLHHGNFGNQHQSPERIGPCSIDFDPSGRLLASVDADGVRLWDCAHPLDDIAHVEYWWAETARFNPDSSYLALHALDGLESWPLSTVGETRTSYRLGPPTKLAVPGASPGIRNLVRWDKTGQRLAATSLAHRSSVVLDFGEETTRRDFESPENTNGLAFHPDGKYLAIGARKPVEVAVWNVDTGVLATRVPGGFFPTFSPAGQWLAVGRSKEYVLLRVNDWTSSTVIPTEHHSGASVFSPGDQLLAVMDGLNVRLVNPKTGQSIATLESPNPNRFSEICFSPNGAHLAVATSNRTIQLWDLRTIRTQLKELGLDWQQPKYAPPSWSSSSAPLTCEIVTKREGS